MLLACRLCVITTLFIREGDQVKSMILGPILAIKVFLVTCMIFPFSSFTIKSTKILVTYFVYFGFVNLQVVGD
jgi:hypothetical protein